MVSAYQYREGLVFGTPFTGIDAVWKALANRPFLKASQCNLVEKNGQYRGLYASRGFPGWQPRDITTMPLEAFCDCHVLICSPPRQQYTTQGPAATGPLLRLADIVAELHRRKVLLAAVVEGSPGLLRRHSGRISFFEKFQRTFAAANPAWVPFATWVLDAKDFGLPISQKRLFAVSCPRVVHDIIAGMTFESEDVVFPLVPPTVAKPCLLRDFLDTDFARSLPNSGQEKRNFLAWKAKFESEVDSRGLAAVAAVDVSRHPRHRRAGELSWNSLPSLTTANYNIAVFSKEWCGLLTQEERARCMGFDIAELSPFLSPRQITVGLGNSTAVNVIGAVLESVADGLSVFFDVMAAEMRSSPEPPLKRRREEDAEEERLRSLEAVQPQHTCVMFRPARRLVAVLDAD